MSGDGAAVRTKENGGGHTRPARAVQTAMAVAGFAAAVVLVGAALAGEEPAPAWLLRFHALWCVGVPYWWYLEHRLLIPAAPEDPSRARLLELQALSRNVWLGVAIGGRAGPGQGAVNGPVRPTLALRRHARHGVKIGIAGVAHGLGRLRPSEVEAARGRCTSQAGQGTGEPILRSRRTSKQGSAQVEQVPPRFRRASHSLSSRTPHLVCPGVARPGTRGGQDGLRTPRSAAVPARASRASRRANAS